MIFQGSGTALITPFTENGVDFDAYSRLLDFQLKNGTKAAIVLGTTGEPATMSAEERTAVIKLAISKLKDKIPVIVGVGSNCTATVIKNAKQAEELGADALLIVTPYYNKCTQGGLIAHYGAIAESTSLPIIAYNVPGRTGVNLLPATFAKLAKTYSNIVATKEASGNMEQIQEVIRLTEGFADVYSGDDSLTVALLALGGKGIISVASNVIPKYVAEMCDNFFNNDLETARKMQLRMLPFVKALFSEVNPIPVKYASKLLGLTSGIVRLPLTEMTEENAKILKVLFEEIKA
ncbi:MAG: 4-hydroxy-tetrahydrodipicolinate synthase [Clostridia bacterium]|nr:4-hydroxy-tetrahydrodipicolinate synthase [Clostridia bacterium]